MKTKQTKFIAVTSQKGGVGKSTLTVIIASYLYYELGYNLAVIDCDANQNSIWGMRKRDKEENLIDEESQLRMKQYFSNLGKRSYKIIKSTVPNAIAEAGKLITENKGEEYDFIFFDFPGTINTEGILIPLIHLDYIFIPIKADMMVLETSLVFARFLIDHVVADSTTRLKGVFVFWNMVDGRTSSAIYDVFDEYLAKEEIPMLKTYLPNQVRYTREQTYFAGEPFRSTYFAPSAKSIKGSNIDLLVAEMLRFVQP